MKRPRRNHGATFKAHVALAAAKAFIISDWPLISWCWIRWGRQIGMSPILRGSVRLRLGNRSDSNGAVTGSPLRTCHISNILAI